ncbi:phage major capsid protein [Bacillus nitratireducens]|uniref:phage major capsid protein n=1 Tax=Bacillus nitratireducens TaxID=2026193 RepID=UPI00089CA338|nr:phage major capsid protein [Bacillus nitratireducens]SEA91299.1 phage major capsid protein, HK97 family [Bacillus nitratireducens]
MTSLLDLKNITTLDIKKDIIEARRFNHDGLPYLFNIIPTQGKTTRVIKSDEDKNVRASFVDEKETNLSVIKDTQLWEVILTPKRIVTGVELSEEFVENTSIDIESHLREILTDRIISELERQMTATGTEEGTEPKNIQKFVHTANRTTTTSIGQAFGYEHMLESYRNFCNNPANKKDAFWIISPEATFSVLDANGHEKLSFENIPDGADATLLGLPVYRKNMGESNSAHEMNVVRPIAYAITNREMYAFAIKDIKVIRIKGDTIQQMKNAYVFVMESYVDGKVINKYARYSAIFAETGAPSPQKAQSVVITNTDPIPVINKTSSAPIAEALSVETEVEQPAKKTTKRKA